MGRVKHSSTASSERIAELKKLINDKNYMDMAINALATSMSKDVSRTNITDSPCYGVDCIACIDKAECTKYKEFKSRKEK